MSRRHVFASLISALSLATAESVGQESDAPRRTAAPIEVRVDPRLELLAIVFRFAGHPEYNMPNSASPYSRAVMAHFSEWKDHPAIERARELRAENGVSYDAVASLAMHATSLDALVIAGESENVWERLDARWTLARANDFLELVADFRDESRFPEFFASNAALYATVEERMRDLLARKVDASWFAEFFGTKATASFAVHPGLLLGGNNFGVGVRHPDGREEITPCIGCWEFDDDGIPTFPDSVLPTIVHEFCHSYVNPVVDAHGEAFDAPGGAIFPRIRAAMERQAYGRWRIVVYESIVRAAVVRYLIAHDDEAAVENELRMNERVHFAWIRGLSDLLGEYESSRDRYPTLDSFAPRLVEFFAKLGAEYDAAPSPPTIAELNPGNGDSAVSPSLQEIVIRFDREMGDGMSVMISSGADRFPKLGPKKARWDADRKTLRIDVRLEPGKEYEFGLNTGSQRNFTSRDGVSLDPIVIRFRTADD